MVWAISSSMIGLCDKASYKFSYQAEIFQLKTIWGIYLAFKLAAIPSSTWCALLPPRTSSTAAAQRNNVPRTHKDELGKPFDCILVKKRIARVNRYRAAAAIELEPVNAVYRFHRKRMMCAKWVAVETEYFNGCRRNSSNREPTQNQWHVK